MEKQVKLCIVCQVMVTDKNIFRFLWCGFSASMIEISNSIDKGENMILNQNVNVFKFKLKYEIACAQVWFHAHDIFVCVFCVCVCVHKQSQQMNSKADRQVFCCLTLKCERCSIVRRHQIEQIKQKQFQVKNNNINNAKGDYVSNEMIFLIQNVCVCNFICYVNNKFK